MAALKVAISLVDSVDLRIILSVLYIITEVMWVEKHSANGAHAAAESFANELSKLEKELPQCDPTYAQFSDMPIGDELLAVKLLGMISRFCSGSAPHFPMKKVVLLLWKVSLVSLGGMSTLRQLKGKSTPCTS